MLVHAYHCCPRADTRQFISIILLELVSAIVEVRTQQREILNQNTKYSSIYILIPIPLLSCRGNRNAFLFPPYHDNGKVFLIPQLILSSNGNDILACFRVATEP